MIKQRHILCLAVMMFFVYCGQGFGATYYVDVDAAGGGDGSLSTPWDEVGDVNGVDFAAGDIIIFQAGDTFNDATLTLAGTTSTISGLTVRGGDFGGATIASDGKPILDGDVNLPIAINESNISDLTLKDLDVSGDNAIGKNTNVAIQSVTGLTIDGIDADGSRGGYLNNETGQNVILVYGGVSGTIEIKNCTIHSYGPADAGGTPQIPSGVTDSIGIVISALTSGTFSIHDNTIYNMNADGIQIFNQTITGTIYNNTIYNCGENAIDLKSTANQSVYSNTIYIESGWGGDAEAMIGVHDTVPTGSVTNIDIYENTFTINDNPALKLHDGDDLRAFDNTFTMQSGGTHYGIEIDDILDGSTVEVFHNKFDGVPGAILIGNPNYGVSIYSNLIINPASRTCDTDEECGGIYENNGGGPSKIYNNTLIMGTGTCDRLIDLETNQSSEVKNNLVSMNDADGYAFLAKTFGTAAVVNNNIWYNPGNAVKLSYEGTDYGSANWSTWTASHAGESYSDPNLDARYAPKSGSIAINTGDSTLGDAYREGLLKSSSWPNGVRTKKQDSKWDIGAFVFERPDSIGIGPRIF